MRGHGDKGLQVSTSRPLHHPNSPDAPPPLTAFPGLCPPPRAPSAGLPSGHLPSLLLTLSLILQLPPSTGTFQEAQSLHNWWGYFLWVPLKGKEKGTKLWRVPSAYRECCILHLLSHNVRKQTQRGLETRDHPEGRRLKLPRAPSALQHGVEEAAHTRLSIC